MSTAASRAQMRDNAETLGKIQTGLNRWLDTTPGQVTLLVLLLGVVMLAGLIGP